MHRGTEQKGTRNLGKEFSKFLYEIQCPSGTPPTFLVEWNFDYAINVGSDGFILWGHMGYLGANSGPHRFCFPAYMMIS